MTKPQHLPFLDRTNRGEKTPLCSRPLLVALTLTLLCFTLVTVWESSNSLPTRLSNTTISLTLPFYKASAASQLNLATILLLPSLLTSTSLSIPLKAIFLPILLAPSSEAASLRPGLNTEYFKRVRKKPATAADLASLMLALLARALGGPHAYGLNLLQGHIETMDLGAWVPVELVTFVLGRPPSRDDLHWWERLSEDAWEAVEAITAWLETEGNFFNKRDLK